MDVLGLYYDTAGPFSLFTKHTAKLTQAQQTGCYTVINELREGDGGREKCVFLSECAADGTILFVIQGQFIWIYPHISLQ